MQALLSRIAIRLLISVFAYTVVLAAPVARAQTPGFDSSAIALTLQRLESKYTLKVSNSSLEGTLKAIGRAAKLRIRITEDARKLTVSVDKKDELGKVLATIVDSCSCEMTIANDGSLLVRETRDVPELRDVTQPRKPQ